MASAGGGAGSGQAGGYGQAGGSTAAGGAASTGTAAPATQSPQNLNQIVRLNFSCYAPRCDRRTSTNIPHHYLLLYIVLVIFYKHWGILGLVCAPGLESATVHLEAQVLMEPHCSSHALLLGCSSLQISFFFISLDLNTIFSVRESDWLLPWLPATDRMRVFAASRMKCIVCERMASADARGVLDKG